MFLSVSYIMGSKLLITMVDGISNQDTWLVVITGFVISIPFLLIYAHLAKRFPGKSMIQMNDIIFGKVIGKIISILYLLYFFSLLTFNITDLSGFYTAYVMPGTPEMVFIVVLVLVCAFAVKKGIAAVSKIGLLTAVFAIATATMTSALLIGKMDFSNFLPVLDKPVMTYVQSTQIVVELPLLEVVALLMVVPMIGNQQKLMRSWILGVLVATLLILLIVVRDTAVLGPASNILGDNSYEAVRLINIGEFLTRIELLIALNNTTLLFIKICVLYYATLTALSQILNIEQNSSLILPLGAIAIVFSAVKVESAVIHTVWGAQYAPVFSFPCTILFPLLMVIVAAIRKLRSDPPDAATLPPTDDQSKQKIKSRAAHPPSGGTVERPVISENGEG